MHAQLIIVPNDLIHSYFACLSTRLPLLPHQSEGCPGDEPSRNGSTRSQTMVREGTADLPPERMTTTIPLNRKLY